MLTETPQSAGQHSAVLRLTFSTLQRGCVYWVAKERVVTFVPQIEDTSSCVSNTLLRAAPRKATAGRNNRRLLTVHIRLRLKSTHDLPLILNQQRRYVPLADTCGPRDTR